MDINNGSGAPIGDNMFWGLPLAFALDETALENVNNMSDDQREVLRERSNSVSSQKEMDDLVRMIAEGKFE